MKKSVSILFFLFTLTTNVYGGYDFINNPDVADLQSVTSLMLKLSILQIKCPQSTKQLK